MAIYLSMVTISTPLLQIRVSNYKLFVPQHDKTNKMNECVQSEDSDRPGHSPSQIRDFTECLAGDYGSMHSLCRQ